MAAVITSISPIRGRVGDEITITGTGFSAANNSVDVITPGGGTVNAQTLTSQGTTELVFTLAEPSGALAVNFQNLVRATNDDDATSASVYWLLKDTHANLIANKLGSQQPGTFDDPSTETPTKAESKDLERVIARDERHDEVGGDSFPNTTSGAEAVKTDATPFAAATPARDTVQAALEMLDAQAVAAVKKATFDANTILKADSDNTPAALTVAEQRLVGRITSGVIAALTAAQARTLINVEDGSTADQTGAEIKSAYEGEADTNAFTDAAAGMLAGIEPGAEVNPDLISQAEAEAGSATTARIFSALRVAQAIAALETGGGGGGDLTLVDAKEQASGASLTVTVPGGTLAADGDHLLVVALYDSAAVAQVAELNWDGVSFAKSTLIATSEFCIAFGLIVRTGATAQAVSSADVKAVSLGGTTNLSAFVGTDAATLSGDVDVLADWTTAGSNVVLFLGVWAVTA